MINFRNIIFAALGFLLTLSCEKEVLYTGSRVPTATGTVRCNVRTVATKSLEMGLDSLKKEGFNIIGIVDSAYYDADDVLQKRGLYFGPSSCKFSSSKWTIDGEPKWISFAKTRFWAWRTSGNVKFQSYADSTLCEKTELSFDYQVKSDGDGDDLLFAYNDFDYNVNTNKDAKLNLYFAHSMARINFMVTPKTSSAQTLNDGSYRNDYELVDITLKEVCDTGHCVITGVRNGYPTFVWSLQAGNVSCTKTFNTTFSVSTPSGWTAKKGLSGSYLSNESIFIIPQTIGATTSLAVTFKNSTNTVTKSVPLVNVGGATEWEPGKYYTYRVAISGDISDPVSSFAVSVHFSALPSEL